MNRFLALLCYVALCGFIAAFFCLLIYAGFQVWNQETMKREDGDNGIKAEWSKTYSNIVVSYEYDGKTFTIGKTRE